MYLLNSKDHILSVATSKEEIKKVLTKNVETIIPNKGYSLIAFIIETTPFKTTLNTNSEDTPRASSIEFAMVSNNHPIYKPGNRLIVPASMAENFLHVEVCNGNTIAEWETIINKDPETKTKIGAGRYYDNAQYRNGMIEVEEQEDVTIIKDVEMSDEKYNELFDKCGKEADKDRFTTIYLLTYKIMPNSMIQGGIVDKEDIDAKLNEVNL